MDPMTIMMLGQAAGGLLGGKGGKGGGGGGGGLGQSIGSMNAMPLATGGLQLLQGHLQRRRAEKLQPALEDTQQVTAMQEYQRRANNAMTGANVSNQMRALQQLQGAGINALARGGNINQASGLQRLQSQAMNDLLAQGQQTEMGYRQMFDEALKGVAERRLRLQTKKADAMVQRAEANIGAGTKNIMAGLGLGGEPEGEEDTGGTTGGAKKKKGGIGGGSVVPGGLSPEEQGTLPAVPDLGGMSPDVFLG